MITMQATTKVSLRNILFATDFSEHSAAALLYAVSLAEKYGAKILAAHCSPCAGACAARVLGRDRRTRGAGSTGEAGEDCAEIARDSARACPGDGLDLESGFGHHRGFTSGPCSDRDARAYRHRQAVDELHGGGNFPPLVVPGADEWAESHGDAGKPFVVFGHVAEQILDLAKERGADLIVLGVRHAGALAAVSSHMPWGIACQVVREAHCPVLTVRG